MKSPNDAVMRAEKAIREVAQKLLPHASLYLFGSRARKDAGRRSDFDLAIIPREGFSERERLVFSESLERSPEIIYPIDLVHWGEASPQLRAKIKREGILWKS
jgi:predicted nucleotidyltransferase